MCTVVIIWHIPSADGKQLLRIEGKIFLKLFVRGLKTMRMRSSSYDSRALALELRRIYNVT